MKHPSENLSVVYGPPGSGKTAWAEELAKNPEFHLWQYRTWYESVRDGFNHSPWEKKVTEGDTIIFDEAVLFDSGKIPDLLQDISTRYKIVLLSQEKIEVEGVPCFSIEEFLS